MFYLPPRLKKFAGMILVLSLVFSSTFFLTPKKAEALDGGGSLMLLAKEMVLDLIAWIYGDIVTHATASQLGQWVNSNFGSFASSFDPETGKFEFDWQTGDAAFLADPENFFRNTAKTVALAQLQGLEITLDDIEPGLASFRIDMLRDVYKDLRLTTTEPPNLQDILQPTLAQSQLEVFGQDFRSGGWNTWMELINNPQNTVQGARRLAENHLKKEIEKAIEAEKFDLTSPGFLTTKRCVPGRHIQDIYKDGRMSVDEFNAAIRQLGPIDAKGCAEYEDITPGSIVQSQTGRMVQLEMDRKTAIDETTEMLASLLSSALRNFISRGLSSLGDQTQQRKTLEEREQETEERRRRDIQDGKMSFWTNPERIPSSHRTIIRSQAPYINFYESENTKPRFSWADSGERDENNNPILVLESFTLTLSQQQDNWDRTWGNPDTQTKHGNNPEGFIDPFNPRFSTCFPRSDSRTSSLYSFNTTHPNRCILRNPEPPQWSCDLYYQHQNENYSEGITPISNDGEFQQRFGLNRTGWVGPLIMSDPRLPSFDINRTVERFTPEDDPFPKPGGTSYMAHCINDGFFTFGLEIPRITQQEVQHGCFYCGRKHTLPTTSATDPILINLPSNPNEQPPMQQPPPPPPYVIISSFNATPSWIPENETPTVNITWQSPNAQQCELTYVPMNNLNNLPPPMIFDSDNENQSFSVNLGDAFYPAEKDTTRYDLKCTAPGHTTNGTSSNVTRGISELGEEPDF